MKWLYGVLAVALGVAFLGTPASAGGCEDVQRAVLEAPATYVVTVQVWIGEKEAYYERTRVRDGRAETLKKRESQEVSFRLDPSQPLAVPACPSLVRVRPGVWEAREKVAEISGERLLVYYLKGGRLVRLETFEEGTVGILFFKRTFRTRIVYDLGAGR